MSSPPNVLHTPMTPTPTSGFPTFSMIARGEAEPELMVSHDGADPLLQTGPASYGTNPLTPLNVTTTQPPAPIRPKRSLSAPTRSMPKVKVTITSPTVDDPERNVLKNAKHAFAKSTFFHGTFTSSHGAMMMRLPPKLTTSVRHAAGSHSPMIRDAGRFAERSLLLLPPGMRQRYLQQLGPAGVATYQMANRPPRLVIPADTLASPSSFRRSLSAGRVSFESSMQRVLPPKRSISTNERLPLLVRGHGRASSSVPRYTQADVYSPRSTLSARIGHLHASLRKMPSLQGVDELGEDEDVEDESEAEEGEPITIMDAFMELLPLAVPSTLSMAIMFALASIPLAFIGRQLGEAYLTGASIGYFIISIIAQYPIFGLTFALDTLASQEYGRDPDSDVLGLLLQRGILVNLAFSVPVCVLLTQFAEGPLIAIYGAHVGSIATEFLHYSPLFLVPLVVFIAFSKFCANQLLPQLPTLAMTCGLIVTPIAQRSLVHMGVSGAMLGMAVAAWAQLVVIVFLTFAKAETRRTFGSIRIGEALDWGDVSAYLKLALPSALFVAAEASSFDLTVLLAAKLGSAEGAAWSAVLNICLPFVSGAGGLSAAACAKVGASLGAGYPADAKRYAFTAVGAAAALALINCALIFYFFDVLMELFGTEGKALEHANALIYIVPFMHMGDSIQFAFQGVFSGCGQNHKGAMILLSSLWAIGIPSACVLAFYFHMGVEGIVLGLTLGLLIESPWMVWAVHNMDWHKMAEDAQVEALEEDEEDEEDEEEDEEEIDDEENEDVELEEEGTPPTQRRRGRSRTPKTYIA